MLNKLNRLSLRKNKGFTLIELLVVIAILAILLVIVLIAINPTRQTRKARNTQRLADVLTILNAVNQHFIEAPGFPTNTPDAGDPPLPIKSGSGGTLRAFCDDLVPDYVAELPFDPSTTGAHFTNCLDYDTGYTVERLSNDRITIAAPESLNDGMSATISATR